VVFVLMTPDDTGYLTGSSAGAQARARQNVIFELGYFLGYLRRASGRVLILHSGPLELPSDLAGMVSIDIGAGVEAAAEAIRGELAGILKVAGA
jgi:predicted nucleotide-binding protein